MECARPSSSARRRAEPSCRRCCWPTTSPRVRGRRRTASGAWSTRTPVRVRGGSPPPGSNRVLDTGRAGSHAARRVLVATAVEAVCVGSRIVELQAEATRLLSELVRFDTVNPPGNERACQEHLAALLEDAGLEVQLLGRTEERPNLVARLRGTGDGPTLCLLSHVDTVYASPQDWTRDPWSGDVA